MKKSDGFTLIELLIVLFITVFLIIGIGYLGIGSAVVMGNQWFTEDGVLRKIQLNHPNAVRVVDAERNVFKRSVITVDYGDGKRGTHCLDSDILFNYNIVQCDK